MTSMVIIAIAGLFSKEPSFECDFSTVSAADVAWLITATIFVLMMTPGLSFFYGGMVGAKNVISCSGSGGSVSMPVRRLWPTVWP